MTKVRKIDSSAVALYYAKEQSINKLPETPVWQQLEPSEINDIGGETTQTARTIIRPDRQNSRGAITDLTASAGFKQEISQNNATELLQGFLFADAREIFKTKPLVGGKKATVTASENTYTVSADVTVKNVLTGSLVKAKGFKANVNNGVKEVETVSEQVLTITAEGGVIAETVGDGSLEVVGYRAKGLALKTDGYIRFELTGANTIGLSVGQWVFVGGDTNAFTTNGTFFARISSILEGELVIDLTIGNASKLVDETADCDLYFGTFIRNEDDVAKIKRTTYTIEESLGYADEERTQAQASYVSGCVPNELTINLEQGALSSMEFGFTGCKFYTRKGSLMEGTRLPAWNEKGYNNANEVYASVLSVHSTDTTNTIPEPLFAYMSNANISINNNASENKAVGVLGNFDVSAGKFDLEISPEVYFVDVDTIKAMQENKDCALQVIVSRDNEGMVFDVPMIGLGSSIPTVSEGEPIKMSLKGNGAKSKFNFTFGYHNFAYLPNVAMAVEHNAD